MKKDSRTVRYIKWLHDLHEMIYNASIGEPFEYEALLEDYEQFYASKKSVMDLVPLFDLFDSEGKMSLWLGYNLITEVETDTQKLAWLISMKNAK